MAAHSRWPTARPPSFSQTSDPEHATPICVVSRNRHAARLPLRAWDHLELGRPNCSRAGHSVS